MKKAIAVTAIDIKDFKRIKLFRAKITTEEGLILIGGENTHGKSSVLDAFLVAVNPGSLKAIKNPIHDGADEAQIAVTIGEFRIVRRISRDSKAGGLMIYRDGQSQPRPTDLLKDLLGELFVDPVRWMEAEPIEQRKILAQILKLDFTEIDAELSTHQNKEKELDEKQLRLKHQAEALEEFPNAPKEKLLATTLTQEIQSAINHNAGIDGKKVAADQALADAEQKEQVIASTQLEIERLQRLLNAEISKKATQESEHQQILDRERTLREEFNKSTLIDLEPLNAQLSNIEKVNNQIDANAAKKKAREEWKAAEEELGVCRKGITELQAKKKAMLAEAQFPVEGLSFDAQGVLFNGQPLKSGASQAEQIRVAVAVSLAQRGQCAPLIVRSGNDLDNKSMALLAEEAARHGAQVFIEVVANKKADGNYDKKADFYIEEGLLSDYQYSEEAAS